MRATKKRIHHHYRHRPTSLSEDAFPIAGGGARVSAVIPCRFSAFHETQRKIEEVIVLAERANDRTDANLIAERIIGIHGRMHGPLNGWAEAPAGHGNNNGKKGSFIGGFRRGDCFSRLTARLREAVVDAKLWDESLSEGVGITGGLVANTEAPVEPA